MKNRNLKKMALLGLAHGLLLNGQVTANNEFDNIEKLIASNPQVFEGLNCEAKTLLNRLNSQEYATSMLAASCGGKGQCSTVANKCGANGKCSTVASKCGANGKCSTIAQRDTPANNLQDPSTVDLKDKKNNEYDPNSENYSYHMMTEQELLLELNDEGARLYKSLSPEGKKLALEVASQACNGTNKCKGLNACKTDKNDCAGKGNCKGQSKCAISDKNLAVKLVYQKMAAKRDAALRH